MFCALLCVNVVIFTILVLLPKSGPCPREEEPDVVNRMGVILDVTVAASALAALGMLGLFAGQVLLKPVHAVPRDERLTGHRTAA